MRKVHHLHKMTPCDVTKGPQGSLSGSCVRFFLSFNKLIYIFSFFYLIDGAFKQAFSTPWSKYTIFLLIM